MPDFSIGFAQFTTLEEDKRTDKSPDVTGSIEVLEEDVAALISHLQTADRETNYRDETVVRLRLAGWNSMFKNRNGEPRPMLKGKLSGPYKPENKPAPAPVAAPSSIDIDF